MNPTRANTDSPLASAISRPTVHAALALTVAIGRFRSTYTSRSVHPTLARGIGGIVPIGEVVAGQVFKGRRTSLRSGSASQVFARSRTASEDEDAVHGPEGRASVGHAFKIGGRAKARRRVRFPSASAAEVASDQRRWAVAGARWPRKRLGSSLGDRVYHTSLSMEASTVTPRPELPSDDSFDDRAAHVPKRSRREHAHTLSSGGSGTGRGIGPVGVGGGPDEVDEQDRYELALLARRRRREVSAARRAEPRVIGSVRPAPRAGHGAW
jgi:hypothetical protein